MGQSQEGQNVVVAFKKQSALGTPASGAGGTGIEVRAGAGLAMSVATIEDGTFRRNKMKRKPRHGMKTVTAAYDLPLMVGNCDPIFAAVLGGPALASFAITEADVTSMTISGGGLTLTGGSGSFITKGVVAGMMGKFTAMATAANDGVWFPILGVTANVLTAAPGYLVDETIDSAFTLTIAKSFSTPTPYVKGYYTFEEHLGDLTTPISKIGTDLVFGSLSITASPSGAVTVQFGLTGRDMTAPTGAAALTSPTFNTQANDAGALEMVDAAIFKNGIAIADLTGCSFDISAPLSVIPVIGSRLSPDVFLGEFTMKGSFTELIADGSSLANFLAEDRLSVLIHCKEREGDPADFVSFYLGDCSFGGWGAPIAEGAMTQTMSLLGGSDVRGAGYADTMLLISTSAT